MGKMNFEIYRRMCIFIKEHKGAKEFAPKI